MMTSFYGEVLTEHNLRPLHKHALPAATARATGTNASCGDQVEVAIEWAQGRIKTAAFTGQGCAVSQASSDMLCDLLIDKTASQAQAALAAFWRLVHDQSQNGDDQLLGEVMVLRSAVNLPARVKCATLAWHVAEQLLREDAPRASLESDHA